MISTVDALLDSGTTVVVYTGQLGIISTALYALVCFDLSCIACADLICDTTGTEMWMKKLKWSGLQQFYNSTKSPLYPSPTTRNTGAYFKSFKNLQFYWYASSVLGCANSFDKQDS